MLKRYTQNSEDHLSNAETHNNLQLDFCKDIREKQSKRKFLFISLLILIILFALFLLTSCSNYSFQDKSSGEGITFTYDQYYLPTIKIGKWSNNLIVKSEIDLNNSNSIDKDVISPKLPEDDNNDKDECKITYSISNNHECNVHDDFYKLKNYYIFSIVTLTGLCVIILIYLIFKYRYYLFNKNQN